MPKVSVLMPVYKTPEKYLREAIESILNQSFDDFELLLLDDCPEDTRVEKIIESYEDKRIKYSRNDKNLGISPTRNKLIDLAQGEYLAVMDHDDISAPNRFEKQVAYLDAHLEVGVVGSYRYDLLKGTVRAFPIENDDICEQMMFRCPVMHPAAMIRKSVLEENNLRYEEAFSPAEDYALWCRLLGKTKFYNIPEVLFKYRNHKNNTSHRQKKKMEEVSLAIWGFVRSQNLSLWEQAKAKCTVIKRIKLFGFLPLLEVKEHGKDCECRLFGFLPLWSSRTKIKEP